MKRYAVSQIDNTMSGIKKGVEYLITEWNEVSDEHPFGGFHIIVKHRDCYCLTNTGCAFLNGARWTIIEEEEPSDDN